jgi:hypothetical protein
MSVDHYRIVEVGTDFAVDHNGAKSGSYATREGAFEAAVAAASNAIRAGHEIMIEVPPLRKGSRA